MLMSCKQADRIFWGIAFCTSVFDNLVLLRGLMALYGTHAGKMSVNAHGLFWATGKKINKNVKNVEFEVFTKMCSLSPRLAIPMLQIVIKHLKVSLIVYFLRGLPFLHSLLALSPLHL